MTQLARVRDEALSSVQTLAKPLCVMVGRNRIGQWVARDVAGSQGGLFKTQDDALRFAHHEWWGERRLIIVSSEHLELFDAPPATASNEAAASST